MTNDIKLIPDIPPEIINAIKEKKLTFFFGAGTSISFGLPSWETLAANFLVKASSDKLFTPSETHQIKDGVKNPRQLISIIYQKYLESSNLERYYFHLKEMLSVNTINYDTSLFDIIKASNSLVVTTNIDTVIDECECFVDKNIYFELDTQKPWPQSGASLVHIHGRIDSPSSIILTVSEYLQRYNNDVFIKYLRNILSLDKVVLFIGYGLNELEILDYVFEKSGIQRVNAQNRIFVLQGYYEYEKPLCDHFALYYSTIGVTQIPFSLNQNQYGQISIIFEEWIKEIQYRTNAEKQRIFEVNDIVANYPTTSNIDQIKQIIQNSRYSESHFFKEITSCKYSVEWLLSTVSSKCFNFELSVIEGSHVSLLSDDHHAINWPAFRATVEIYSSHQDDVELRSLFLAKSFELSRYLADSKYIPKFQSLIYLMSQFEQDLPELYKDISFAKLVNVLSKKYPNIFDAFLYRSIECLDIANLDIWNGGDNYLLCIFYFLVGSITKKLNNSYPISEFIRKFEVYLVSKYANEINVRCYRAIDKLSRKDQFFLYEISTIKEYDFNEKIENNSLSDDEFILYWFIKSFDNIETKLTKAGIVQSLINSSKIIQNKLAVFLVGKYFDEYSQIFFMCNRNLLNIHAVFSECYLLIRDNLLKISIENANAIDVLVQNIEIDDEYPLKEKHKQFEIYKLLQKIDRRFSDKVTELENSDYTLFRKPENISRMVEFKDFSSNDIVDLFNAEIGSYKNLQDKIEYINGLEPKFPYSIDHYQTAFQKFVESNQSHFSIKSVELDDLRLDFLPYLIEGIDSYYSNDQEDEVLAFYLDILRRFVKENEFNGTISVSRKILSRIKCSKKFIAGLDKGFFEILDNRDFIRLDKKVSDFQEIVFWVDNNLVCILLDICLNLDLNLLIAESNQTTSTKKTCISYIANKLLTTGVNIEYKLFFIRNISSFYKIDEIWTSKIIDSILENDPELFGQNFSLFLMQSYRSQNLLMRIDNSRLIDDYLLFRESRIGNDAFKKELARWYVYEVIMGYDYEKSKMLKFISTINDPGLIKNFYIVISATHQITRDKKVRLRLFELTKYIVNIEPRTRFNVSSDQIIRYYFKLLVIFENPTKEMFDYALILIQEFKNFLSNDFIETLKVLVVKNPSFAAEAILTISRKIEFISGNRTKFGNLIKTLSTVKECESKVIEIENNLIIKGLFSAFIKDRQE